MYSLRTWLPALLLAGALTTGTLAAGGRQSADQEASAREAARAERLRAEAERQAEASRREAASFLGGNYWETPAGRRRADRMQREAFQEAMARFRSLGGEPWPTRYDPDSARWVLANRDQAKDLEEATGRIIGFVERSLRLDSLKVVPPPVNLKAGELETQLGMLRGMITGVVPDIPALLGGEQLDVSRFLEVRETLAQIRLLGRALQDR